MNYISSSVFILLYSSTNINNYNTHVCQFYIVDLLIFLQTVSYLLLLRIGGRQINNAGQMIERDKYAYLCICAFFVVIYKLGCRIHDHTVNSKILLFTGKTCCHSALSLHRKWKGRTFSLRDFFQRAYQGKLPFQTSAEEEGQLDASSASLSQQAFTPASGSQVFIGKIE